MRSLTVASYRRNSRIMITLTDHEMHVLEQHAKKHNISRQRLVRRLIHQLEGKPSLEHGHESHVDE